MCLKNTKYCLFKVLKETKSGFAKFPELRYGPATNRFKEIPTRSMISLTGTTSGQSTRQTLSALFFVAFNELNLLTT